MSENPAPNDPTQYPPGWDAERAQRLIDHDDKLTDDEWAAEDEATFGDAEGDVVLVEIPKVLLPTVETMIKAFKKARGGGTAERRESA